MVIETVNDPFTRALRALADPNRRRLVEQLRSHEECVSVLAERLGLSTALVSHHLRLLVGAGFVHERRSGSWRCYSLVPEYLDWLQGALDELLDPNLPAEAACCTNACGERRVTPPASSGSLGRRRAAAHWYDHVCVPNNLVGEELWRLVRHIDANLGHNSNHGPIDLLRRVRSGGAASNPASSVMIQQGSGHL